MKRLIVLVLILTPRIMHPMEPDTLEKQYLEEELHVPAQVSLHFDNLCVYHHEAAVRSAVFSPAGDKVLTASSDNIARIWDTETGKLIHTLRGHTGDIYSAVFSPAGDKIVTCSRDKTARTWDTETGKPLHILGGSTGPSLLNTLTAFMWGVSHTNFVLSATFNPTGDKIATCSLDGTAKIWDTETGKLIHTLNHQLFDVTDVLTAAFNPAGDKLVTGSAGIAVIWDTETGKSLGSFSCHKDLVITVVFNQAGNKVLTGSLGTAGIWYIPTGDKVVTGSVDTGLDTERVKLLHTLEGHTGKIYSAMFNPKGDKVLTESWDTARIWDTETGKLLHVLHHTDLVQASMFNSTGDRILTCSGTAIRIWDTETGKLLHALEGHTGDIYSAVFNPKGDKVVTASDDGTAKIWGLRERK